MLKRLLFFAYGADVVSDLPRHVPLRDRLRRRLRACPRRLDGPLQTSLPAALPIDCALLTIFAVQHSVMARRWFKERWTQIVPWTIERSTYVLCASLALLLLFWQWRPIGIEIWSVDDPAARVVLWTLFAAGWATVLTVTFLINHFDLFGLRQVWLPLIGRPYTRVSVPDAAAVSIRAASALLRLSARVLDDADDDAGAPGVRASPRPPTSSWRFSSRNAISWPSTARRTRSTGARCRCCCPGADDWRQRRSRRLSTSATPSRRNLGTVPGHLSDVQETWVNANHLHYFEEAP